MPRAGIVVTGTEVLTGRVVDRNGPWLAERLRDLGVDLAHIAVVGDRPGDVEATLRFFASEGVDVVCTSGGLGPTEDDLTAQVVGDFQGRPLEHQPELEAQVWEIVSGLLARWPGLDQEALRHSARKQAMVPRGATVLPPVGTAPSLVVPPADGGAGPVVVVLPGPPRELQPMWADAEADPLFRAAIAGATRYEQRMLRLFGIPESEIAETMRRAREDGVDLDALEVTTCLRRGEVEIVTRYEPAVADVYAAFEACVRDRHADTLFSDDGTSVDEQVAGLLRARGLTIAAAESCTGGLLLGRLTDLAGSSDYVVGGVVAYANDVKSGLVGVDAALIETHGAVSQEIAQALADGARTALGADVGVGITGVAGPGGGTEDKPVGLVWVSVAGPDGARLTRSITVPGSRADVRDRSTTVGLHMVRRLLVEHS